MIMGNKATKQAKCNAVMLGLDCAGKTSILETSNKTGMKLTTPTIGMYVEEVSVMDMKVYSWDVGGEDLIRGLFRHYFNKVNAIIWVQDCSDIYRLAYSKDELNKILLSPELKGHPLLLFANKQDLPNAIDKEELICSWNLHSLDGERAWQVFHSVATEKDTLQEGFAWLQQVVADPSTYVPHSLVQIKNANNV